MENILYVITEKNDKELLTLASVSNLRDLTNSSYNSGVSKDINGIEKSLKKTKNAITQAFSRAGKNESGYKVIDFGTIYQVEKMTFS